MVEHNGTSHSEDFGRVVCPIAPTSELQWTTYLRNWPEGLFIALVIIGPVVTATIIARCELLGLHGDVGIGMMLGLTGCVSLLSGCAYQHAKPPIPRFTTLATATKNFDKKAATSADWKR